MGASKKIIITVLSCKKNASLRKCILNTWAKNISVEVFFIVGDNYTRIEDNILYIDCPDDYLNHSHKQIDALRFLYDKDFTHIFCCDDDTYVVIDRLLNCGYEDHDYMGATVYTSNRVAYAYGGSGFFLSKKAVEKGLKVNPIVKTSLAPGSRVVTDYLAKADLQKYLDSKRQVLLTWRILQRRLALKITVCGA